jgi:Domain of unknown function (DUF6265)
MQKAIAFLLLGLCISFTGGDGIKPFLWLEGTWSMPRPKGGYRLEIWEKKNAEKLAGKGLKVLENDTIVLEAIELYHRDDQFWYVPIVPDQNNSLPVPFKLVASKDNRFVFENPEHDFPQRIIYHFRPVLSSSSPISSTGDSLYVRVESLDGKGMDFNFLKQ